MAEVFAVPPDVPRDGVRAQEDDDARSSTDQVPGRRPGSNELRRDDGADRQHELLDGQVHGAGRVVVLTDRDVVPRFLDAVVAPFDDE
jgi:hypothetical protein